MNKHYYFLCLTLLLICIGFQSRAQNSLWAKQVVSIMPQNNGVEMTPDGTMILCGNFNDRVTVGDKQIIDPTFQSGHVNVNFFVASVDRNGATNWINTIKAPYVYGRAYPDAQGNVYVSGQAADSVTIGHITLRRWGSFSFFARYDAAGNLSWAKIMSNAYNVSFTMIKNYHTNGVTVIKHEHTVVPGTDPRDSAMVSYFKFHDIDATGTLTLQRTITFKSTFGSAYPMHIDKNNNVYLFGAYRDPVFIDQMELKPLDPQQFQFFIAKCDVNGKPLWLQRMGSMVSRYNIYPHTLHADRQGNLYVTGRYSQSSASFGNILLPALPGENIFMAKYSSDGKVLWAKRLGDGAGVNITVNNNDEPILTGHFVKQIRFDNRVSFTSSQAGPTPFVVKYTPDGNALWAKKVTTTYGEAVRVFADQTRNVYMVGSYTRSATLDRFSLSYTPNINSNSGFIAKIEDTSVIREANRVRGKIFEDLNANCRQEAGEKGLTGMIVQAVPGNYYTSTAADGSYVLELPAGSYTISQVLPAQDGLTVSQVCPSGSYRVTFAGNDKDTTGFNFGNKLSTCPYLVVDVSSARRRRCFRGQTVVQYANSGFAEASNVQIKVHYPQYVVPISSTRNWASQQGDMLTFNIGTLAAGQSGYFVITDSVICGNEGIRGLTQCTKATISTANRCHPEDPRWDRSRVVVSGNCSGANALLKIKNEGTGNMSDSSQYRIFIDGVISKQGKFKLNSDEELSFTIAANGRTIRLEADQRPYHPGSSQPSATLEGCVVSSTALASASRNLVNILPQDDADDHVSIQCLPIVDSYDPNDKQVFPQGVTNDRLVLQNTRLNYLVRFQNTGTDTAYTVIIKDTLSQHVDISTLKIGASSHPVKWEVSGKGQPVITWTFNNINLVDHKTNEPKSHGFVSFEISQKKDLPVNTKIMNKAHIYFDFNSAIITNEVFNTVTDKLPSDPDKGKDIIMADTPDRLLSEPLSIYPNPGDGSYFIAFTTEHGAIDLVVRNQLGQEVKTIADMKAEGSRYVLDVRELPQGVYTVEVRTAKGKAIKKVVKY